jgi:hypothetical protein
MSVVVVTVVLLGAIVAAEVAIGRRRRDETDQPDEPDQPHEPGSGRSSRVLMLLGLGLLAVSLVVPFAENEGGCLDHCYEARRWYWWNPAHNLGAPLLLIGIVGVAMRLRATTAAGLVVWTAAICGWLGAVFTAVVAPAIVDEFVYGGPPIEVFPTLWLAPAGWALLWAESIRAPDRPRTTAG